MVSKGLFFAMVFLVTFKGIQCSIEADFYEAEKEVPYGECLFQESFDSDDIDRDGFLNQDEFCNALMIKFDGEIDIESCFDTFPTFDMDQDLKLSCQGKIHIGLATVT